MYLVLQMLYQFNNVSSVEAYKINRFAGRENLPDDILWKNLICNFSLSLSAEPDPDRPSGDD